ncbi:MAG: hypothetical protein JWQ71_3001 [Pedosphaera sp.]|nr:hypothetical protein [Pedosphaera sp.]
MSKRHPIAVNANKRRDFGDGRINYKTIIKPMKSLINCIAALTLMGVAVSAKADTTFTVNPGAAWLGFMNVFEIPANGGGYVFGNSWGAADLVATFSGNTLTLAPNSVNDPSSFWYTPSGMPGAVGNKTMDASLYVESNDGSLGGQTITFTGQVLSNTLTTNTAYTSVAFIKDFAPDFSSSVSSTVALTPGVFNISLATINDPTRHVQYGFETIGPDVWITDVGNYGTVKIAPVSNTPTAVAITPSLAGGTLKLSFPTQNGFAYTVQYKTNLTDASWSTLTVTNGTGASAVVTDTTVGARRLYRLSIQ